MNIKKITKRNMKFMGKGLLRIGSKFISVPMTLGFIHASYLYFYITNPNGTDEELYQFLDNQAGDLGTLIRDTINNFMHKIDIDEDVERWMRRLDTLEFFIISGNKHGCYAYLDSVNEIRANIQTNGFVTGIDRCKIRHMEDEYGLKEV